jgi:hypothetical protein
MQLFAFFLFLTCVFSQTYVTPHLAPVSAHYDTNGVNLQMQIRALTLPYTNTYNYTLAGFAPVYTTISLSTMHSHYVVRHSSYVSGIRFVFENSTNSYPYGAGIRRNFIPDPTVTYQILEGYGPIAGSDLSVTSPTGSYRTIAFPYNVSSEFPFLKIPGVATNVTYPLRYFIRLNGTTHFVDYKCRFNCSSISAKCGDALGCGLFSPNETCFLDPRGASITSFRDPNDNIMRPEYSISGSTDVYSTAFVRPAITNGTWESLSSCLK